jgi:hypothetical protein
MLLDRIHYLHHHDRALEIIREPVSFSIANARKGLTTNISAIGFIRESACTKTTNKPFSILDKPPDWISLIGRYEKQYKKPPNSGFIIYDEHFCLFKTKKRLN